MKPIKGSTQAYNAQPAFRNVGVIFAATGGILLASAHFWESAEQGTRAILVLAGTACLLVSFFLLAYRDRTVLDPSARSYSRKKGFVWAIATTQGSFEDFEGIEIQEMKTPGASGSSTNTSYVGQIVLKMSGRPIQVATSISLDKATRKAQEAAKALDIPFIGLR